MEKSVVYMSMEKENDRGCSWAIVKKQDDLYAANIILVLKDKEVAIFDYDKMLVSDKLEYLLLKHYQDSDRAYSDFMKLVGKMCKKSIESKYFLNHISEDNRMVVNSQGSGMMLASYTGLKEEYDKRKKLFLDFVLLGRKEFTIID